MSSGAPSSIRASGATRSSIKRSSERAKFNVSLW